MTSSSLKANPRTGEPHKPNGNIKQSICRWCYGQIPLETLATEAVKLGFKSIELLTIDEYKATKPFGLTCAMLGRVSITEGLNRKENHDRIEKSLADGERWSGYDRGISSSAYFGERAPAGDPGVRAA